MKAMKWFLALGAVLAVLMLVFTPMDLMEQLITVGSLAGFAGIVSFPKGDEAMHYVSADWDGTEGDIDTATWVPLDGLGEYTRSNTANTTDHRIYGRGQAVTTVGVPGRTVNLSGWYAMDDTGQDLLRSHMPGGASAGVELGYMYLRDGANGYAIMVSVGGGEERSNAEGGLQPVSFTLAPQSDPIDVAGFS